MKLESKLYYIFYPVIWILSRLPFPIAYLISDFVFFILYYIIGYRKEVVKKNLQIAFPEKSEAELSKIHKKNIAHFCDMFIEMIKSLGMSKKEMRRRFQCENIELVNEYAASGRPVICMFGHQASYEWTMVLTDQMNFSVYGVYKPLKNKKFDALIRRIRMKFDTKLIAMKQANFMIKQTAQKGNAMYALVADQSPSKSRSVNFVNFFNHPTAVFKGGERFAKEFNGIAVFLQVTKVKRGFYKSKYVLISDKPAETEDNYITSTFFNLLEKQIRTQPELYLWTHKRWKASVSSYN